MKYLILLAILYVVYRYWKRKPDNLSSGEEGEYIEYEEVVEEDKKMKN